MNMNMNMNPVPLVINPLPLPIIIAADIVERTEFYATIKYAIQQNETPAEETGSHGCVCVCVCVCVRV